MKTSWFHGLLGIFLFVNVLQAQQPEPPAPPAAPPSAADEKVPVRERERTVYVPYTELEKVFKDGGKGVFLPYREFLDLWNELTLKREEEDRPPPADAVLARAEYTGRVEGDSVILDAVLSVESFKKGWVQLPLVDKAAPGIGAADTGKAVLRSRADGADLLLPEKGTYEIRLKIYAPVLRRDGKARLVLNLPRAPVSRLSLNVPGEGLEFSMNPAAAFTAQVADGQTQFSCFFGSGAAQEIAWSAEEAATQMTPLILADSKLSTQIGVGSVATTADIALRILRAPVEELRITLPAAQQVLGVTGAGIKEWQVIEPPGIGGDINRLRSTLVITPEKPLRDEFQVKLVLETPATLLPAEVRVPEIEILGAAYARGQAVVKAEPQLDATPKTLTAAARTQASAGGTGEVGTFRLLRQPYQLTFDVAEATPQVEVASTTKVDIRRAAATVDAGFVFKVRRVGLFEARIGLPPQWTITEVMGELDQWNVENATTAPVLVVKLPQQKTGEFKIELRARQTRAQPVDDVTLPVFSPQGVVRHEAVVGVGLHSSLEANTKDQGGFQQEDVAAMGTQMPQQQALIQRGSETTLAFRYRDDAKPAVLSLKSRATQVSVEVLTLVEAREQSTRHTWTLAFDVAYAATDRFVLAVPKAVADEVRFVDPLIKEINKAYAPAQPPALPDADTYTLWEVVLRSEKLGAFTITGTHEKIAAIETGKTAQIELLQVHVPGAFQETGQVAVVKADSLEIRKAEAETLEEIDARELATPIARPGVFLAYKYRSLPVKLSVEMAKNSYFAVPQAMVTHADLITAVATDRAQTTEAVYWVKNNDLQFLVVRLPPGARLVSDVFVDRAPQQPMRREGSDDLLVRLPSGGARAAFAVRLVFETPSPDPGKSLGLMGSIAIAAPVVDAGVLETRHRLYLPDKDWHYTRISGPLTREARERGWGRARRLIDPLIPAFGPQIDTLDRSVWTNPPTVQENVRSLFGFQVPQQGHLETLRRLGAPADVGVGYRSRKLTFTYEAIAFLVTLILGLRLRGAEAGRKLMFLAVAGFGAMLCTGLLSAADVPVAIAVMMAVALLAAAWAAVLSMATLKAIWRWWTQPPKRRTPPPTPPPPAAAATTPSTHPEK